MRASETTLSIYMVIDWVLSTQLLLKKRFDFIPIEVGEIRAGVHSLCYHESLITELILRLAKCLDPSPEEIILLKDR